MDLLGEDLAEGPPEDGEVLGENEDLPPVDRAPAGDDAVGQGPGALDVEAVGPVTGQHVELDEAARVEQHLEPFPGGELAPSVLTLDGRRAAGVEGRLLELAQLLHPLLEGMGDGGRRGPALVAVERLSLGLLLYVRFLDRHAGKGSAPLRRDRAGEGYFLAVTSDSFVPSTLDAWASWGARRVMPMVPKSTPFWS